MRAKRTSGVMSISSIGVQQIMPRTGIGPDNSNPAMDDSLVTQENQVDTAPDRGATAPGTGQVVDKLA